MLDVQLDGVYRATQVFAEAMETGSIVHVSSLAPQVAAPNSSTYSAGKGSVDANTRAAAKELAPDIRVNAIAPGYVVTPQNEALIGEGTEARERIRERCPMGDVADREEVAGAPVYLASDAASYSRCPTCSSHRSTRPSGASATAASSRASWVASSSTVSMPASRSRPA